MKTVNMSDFEIIKELEKEIGVSLNLVDDIWQERCTYSLENNFVNGLNLQGCGLSKIPDSLTRLKQLKNIDISNNIIENPLPLLLLNRLENLSIHLNSFEISPDPFGEFLSKAKNIKRINFIGSNLPLILFKQLLNHDFLLATRHFRDRENVVFFNNYEYFPPLPMLELGYNNPKFYFENHMGDEKARHIDTIDDFSAELPSEDLHTAKQDIISELLEKYYSQFKKEREMPYAIHKFLVYSYQGVQELNINNISVDESLKKISDPRWIFLTGENGYGKTSILQIIAIGLFGTEDKDRILSKYSTIYLEYKNSEKYHVNSIEKDQANHICLKNFAAYGSARLNKDTKRNDKGKTYSLFNSDGKLLDIEDELAAWEKDSEQSKYFKSAKAILLDLLHPQVTDLYIERKGTTSFVKYIEEGEAVGKEFSELASGYRSIIAMVGDIIIRLSENQPEIENFNELAGIVIIDEIDLHLHPKWQKALVEKLTETFPKIQFIASTHSPIPLLGAPEDTVVINVQRDEEKGITAEKLDVDFSTLTPNSILTSPIFGFEELIPVSKSKNKFVNTEDDYKKVKEKEKKRKEISEYLNPEKTNEFLNLLNDDGE